MPVWNILLRHAMQTETLGKLTVTVEADEAYIDDHYRSMSKRHMRGHRSG